MLLRIFHDSTEEKSIQSNGKDGKKLHGLVHETNLNAMVWHGLCLGSNTNMNLVLMLSKFNF